MHVRIGKLKHLKQLYTDALPEKNVLNGSEAPERSVFIQAGIGYLCLQGTQILVCICISIHGEEYSVLFTVLLLSFPFPNPPPQESIIKGMLLPEDLTNPHLKHSMLKGLLQVSYAFGRIRGLHFYKPHLLLVSEQAGRWVKLCEAAGKEPGKSSTILACYCSKSPSAAQERLLRLLHRRDGVCLKTLLVRANCFRSNVN